MKLKTILFGTGALLGSAMLSPTQEATAQTAADAMLEEIVVTARRREESLADLPLSVVAISADAMQAQGIYNIEQIGEFAANVSLTTSDRMGHSRVFIRGIGGGFPNPIQVFGSGMYIDGHYLAGSLGTYMSTVDIERVEVLRGPQGTLFGKNTTGGLINIISTKPQPEFESSLTLRAGEFGQQDLRAMVNVPFSDNVFGRFSFSSEQSDGYYTNRFTNSDQDDLDVQGFRGALRFTPGENWTIDTAVSIIEERSGQRGAQCRTRPTQEQVDNLANRNAGGFTDDTPPEVILPGQNPDVLRNHPPQIYTGPVFADGVGAWGGETTYPDGTKADIGGHIERLYAGATLDFWAACDTDVSLGEFVTSGEKDQYTNIDNDAVFVSANWDSSGSVGGLDNLGVTINASWRDTSFPWLVDRDKTPLGIDTLGTSGSNTGLDLVTVVTRSFELLFEGQVSDRLEFVAGVHFFEEESKNGNGDCWAEFKNAFAADPLLGTDIFCDREVLLFEFLPPDPNRIPTKAAPGGPGGAAQNVNVFTESSAIFGHLTYALNDMWDLDLGVRYTEDDRSFQIVEFDASGTCFWLRARHCEPTLVMNNATTINDGFFNDAAATFSDTTPLISLTRHFEGGDRLESGLVYFSIAEGFLTGSFNDELNVNKNPSQAPLVEYGPESVTNFEVGFKGTFADGRVRLAADVFLMDYTDKQETLEIDNAGNRFGPDPAVELTQNAGEVEIIGIELELRASPWDGGFVTVDLSYLDNEYKSFLVEDLLNPGSLIDRSQEVINDRTPDWTLNASVGHTFQLASGATLSPLLGMYAQGDYEWMNGTKLGDPPTFCHQDDYATFRARLTYEPPERNWSASFYGSNIFDERYFLDCDGSRGGVWDYTYGKPDAWGFEFVARWGNN